MSDESLDDRLINDFLEKQLVSKVPSDWDYAKPLIGFCAATGLGFTLSYLGGMVNEYNQSLGVGLMIASLICYIKSFHSFYKGYFKLGE